MNMMKQNNLNKCEYCGKGHSPRNCPAYGKYCNYCNGKNHFESVCRKKRNVNTVDTYADVQYDCNDVQYDDTDRYGYDVPDYNLNDDCLNSLSIYAVGVHDPRRPSSDPWSILLPTPYENGRGAVQMKIDTQAQCNVLSK